MTKKKATCARCGSTDGAQPLPKKWPCDRCGQQPFCYGCDTTHNVWCPAAGPKSFVKGWAVEVSEPRLNSTARGMEWWLAYRRAMPAERFTERQHSPVGSMVTVACDDREHATAVESLFLLRGDMPRAAVKLVRTVAAAE